MIEQILTCNCGLKQNIRPTERRQYFQLSALEFKTRDRSLGSEANEVPNRSNMPFI